MPALLAGPARASDGLPACPPPQAAVARVALVEPVQWRTAGHVGVNANFVLEDDAFWAGGAARRSLGQLAPTTLRFPGGEEADNYDWQRHALDRPKAWPAEPEDEAGRAARTDYREFLQRAAELGVESVFLEVNIDTAVQAAQAGDVAALQAGATRAALWVREVAKSRPPMPVYWEIGNEPDVGSGYPLTATEYAQVLRVYAAAMRAEDPAVRIGAAGPLEAGASGFADLLTAEQLARVRSLPGRGTGACNGRYAECVATLRSRLPGEAPRVRWWPVVSAGAGDAFDFVVVHRYDRTRFDEQGEPQLAFTAMLDRLRQAVAQQRGRPVAIAVTEWNTPSLRRPGALGEAAHVADFAVQAGNVLLGAGFSHVWPLRLRSRSYRQQIGSDGTLTAGGRVLAFYAGVRPGDRVAHQAPGKRLYAFRYRQPQRAGYVLANARQQGVLLAIPEAGREARVSALVAGQPVPDCVASRRDGAWQVMLPPGAVARVQVDLAP